VLKFNLKLLFCCALFSTLLFSSTFVPVFAEQVTDDFQAWQIGTIRGSISKRILYYLDVQNNEVDLTSKQGQYNGKTHEGQLLVRPALGFRINKHISLWQGYGWTPSFQPQFRNENQIWEQVVLEKQFKHLQIANRTRLEIRRIADADGTALRLRNQLRLAIPLGRTQWSLVAYDEPFFNLNTVGNGPRSGFNQNWLFTGINRRINKHFNMELGYLNNYVRNFAPVPDRMNHVIMAGFNMNMN
jgi:hypothetical protein